MLYQTEGIVLSQNDLAEYDRVISIFTKDEGQVSAVVKGARRPLSKLSPLTQPYSRGHFQLWKGRSLDRVTQVSPIASYPGIMQDYKKMVYAGMLSELVSSLTQPHESNVALYDFLCQALKALEEREDPWPVTMWGVLGILARTGFAPSFGSCAVCGRPGASPLFFSPEAGGVVCAACRELSGSPDELTWISPGVARTLDMLSSGSSGPTLNARGSVREESTRTLLSFVTHTLGRRLNSSSLVERIDDGEGNDRTGNDRIGRTEGQR